MVGKEKFMFTICVKTVHPVRYEQNHVTGLTLQRGHLNTAVGRVLR
jgi:hypothetical protein